MQPANTLATTELKPPTIDWSVEDVHTEFAVFKTLDKIWLETKGIHITNNTYLGKGKGKGITFI